MKINSKFIPTDIHNRNTIIAEREAEISLEQSNINPITIETEEFEEDYIMIYKDSSNIIDDCSFAGNDKLICKSIIDSLEAEAMNKLSEEKCVSIPNIGTFRRNMYRINMNANYLDFKEKRKTMDKEEYKSYVKNVMNKQLQDIKDNEEARKKWKKLKKTLLKQFTRIYKDYGKVYANAWLYCQSLLEVIHFDEEIEEVYENFRH